MSNAFDPDLGSSESRLPPTPGQPGYKPPQENQLGIREPQDQGVTRQENQLGIREPQDQGVTREAYIPSMRNRPYSQWGQPDFAMQGAMNYPGLSPGPFMPQPNDFPGLIHAIVMGVGRWGSHYSAMPAIAMGTYATAYWNAYAAGMKERAGQNYQQYRQARQMYLDRQDEEIKAYSDVYAAYHDDKGNITNIDAYRSALGQVTARYGDNVIRNALANGDYGMIDRILAQRDGHLNDARKMRQQEEKNQELEEERKQRMEAERLRMEAERLRIEAEKRKAREDAQWGAQPPPATTPSAAPPATPDATPGATPGVPAKSPSVSPSTSQSPEEETGSASRKSPETTAGGPATASGNKSYKLPPGNTNVDYAARQSLLNRSIKVPPDHQSDVDTRAAAYRDAFDQIDKDPNINTREKLVAAVKDVFPEMGQMLQGYLDGRMTDIQASRFPLITDLASKVGGKLSDKDEDEAQRMADYLIAPYSQAQRNAVGQRGVRARAVMERADEIVKARGGRGYDQKEFASEQRAQTMFDSGRPAEQMDAINTAVSHLATLDAYADALDSGLPQTIQAATNRFLTEFGYSPPNNFDAARDIVANEVVRAIVTTGGGVTDRQEARERIFSAQTAGQIKDVTNTYRSLLSGRLEPLMRRWEQTTGRSRAEFIQRLTPETQAALIGQAGKAIPPKASVWDTPHWPNWPGESGTLGGQLFPPESIVPTIPGTITPLPQDKNNGH